MKLDQSDWKRRIVEMVAIKQEMRVADRRCLWHYHLPRVAATESQLLAAEKTLGEPIDQCFRRFLGFANGWPAFYQTVDLFGAGDLIGGELFECGQRMLGYLHEVALAESGFSREDLMPIAATPVDLDLFVMVRPSRPKSGTVVWFAGGEIDRFSNFDEFFASMVAYNRIGLSRLRSRGD